MSKPFKVFNEGSLDLFTFSLLILHYRLIFIGIILSSIVLFYTYYTVSDRSISSSTNLYQTIKLETELSVSDSKILNERILDSGKIFLIAELKLNDNHFIESTFKENSKNIDEVEDLVNSLSIEKFEKKVLNNTFGFLNVTFSGFIKPDKLRNITIGLFEELNLAIFDEINKVLNAEISYLDKKINNRREAHEFQIENRKLKLEDDIRILEKSFLKEKEIIKNNLEKNLSISKKMGYEDPILSYVSNTGNIYGNFSRGSNDSLAATPQPNIKLNKLEYDFSSNFFLGSKILEESIDRLDEVSEPQTPEFIRLILEYENIESKNKDAYIEGIGNLIDEKKELEQLSINFNKIENKDNLFLMYIASNIKIKPIESISKSMYLLVVLLIAFVFSIIIILFLNEKIIREQK